MCDVIEFIRRYGSLSKFSQQRLNNNFQLSKYYFGGTSFGKMALFQILAYGPTGQKEMHVFILQRAKT